MAPAMYFITAYIYNVDPGLVLARHTELGPAGLVYVEESSVYRQHCIHAITAISFAALACAALTILFVFVPGHRL